MLALLLAATAMPAAVEVRRLAAPEAHQGAAADATSVYAVANSGVARYDKATGKRVAVWSGDPAHFPHLNSCTPHRRELVCVSSNYPHVPMASQMLWLDPRTMTLKRTRDLGHGYGSLTWATWAHGSWWACFANYDGNGGEPGRDHRATTLVRYSAGFVVRRTWRFPDAMLERLAPRSASGGAWGADGLLYVTGHDRPELYALRVPRTGDTLELVATMATPTGGQAIGWDGAEPRLLWSIERATAELVASRVPPVAR